MIHSPLADVLGVNIVTANLGDCVDEPLNHLAHRVRLVLERLVLRILPHHNDALRLVVVKDFGEVWEHDAVLSQPFQPCHLRCRVPPA